MRAVDIITKKRHGEALTKEEINFFIEGFVNGSIPIIRRLPCLWLYAVMGWTAGR